MRKFRVIDLFSGCGGISLGFKNTDKVDIVGAIDFDKAACETYSKNFPEAKVICGDINQISVESTGFSNIDIIIGGPPCQGFSRLNYWDKDRDNDPRNELFFQYLRFVDELHPKAILIENVKNILAAKNGYVPKNINHFLSERGYNVSSSILCAADYGVPQMRYRAFFVAVKKIYGEFDFSDLSKYKTNIVTVDEALSDIEEIEESAKKTEQGTVYVLGNPKSNYQRRMQALDKKLYNHMIYYPAKNVQEMMTYVPEGGNWRCVPEELFKSKRENRYTNYLRRIESNKPSITIDTGHNVYFHPKFNRVPTIRESARIQSFPDTFIFYGNKGQQFKQVGNAVPPMLAEAICKAMIDTLEKKPRLKLLDLFCGAGGLSLGFENAGFKIKKAIDIDSHAVNTYNYNRSNKVAEVKDITSIDKSFVDSLGEIDGIIGGPPCQGFSTAGQRIIDDDRNKLYREYFRVLESVNPKFFVIENVTGILTFAKGLVKDDIIRRANDLGYRVFQDTLDTSEYGIPQIRKRVIFIGIKEEYCNGSYVFPAKKVGIITVEDAIGDLPSLDKGEDNTHYVHPPVTEYQKWVRDGMTQLHNHILSVHSEDTKRTIALVPEGGSIRDIPVEKRGGRNYHALLRKMDRSKPSLCIDTGHRTYFHYEEKRIPSTREVARIQSFPDSYIFTGPRNDQQKQVGNAVPPILAELIAKSILNYLFNGGTR